jgi:hypothetical protein
VAPPAGNIETDRASIIAAHGSGIRVSPDSDGNEIPRNTFEPIAVAAVVLRGDRNVVETRSPNDAVRDHGSRNRVSNCRREPR